MKLLLNNSIYIEMKGSKYMESQIIKVIRENEAGCLVAVIPKQ